ncbi:unnamed protein product [Gongylonema pulchrum]|uniref:Col_cuticle_N domain-containing protein n=1 Tax=Gongylonema pulchrum TaxID=637853 RepID=A0A183DLA0_9BILA|nr:unnamed protein product [Gongylonema pulchrum]
MHEARIIAVIAATCSTMAILACVVVIPTLYNTINEVGTRVWIILLLTESNVSPTSSSKGQAFGSAVVV